MTAIELIEEIRIDLLDDPENTDSPEDNLWSTPSLLRHLIQAEREVARRTLCLSDNTTANIATFTAAPGWNALSAKVLIVEDVVLGGTRLQLGNEDEFRVYSDTDYDDPTGTPKEYILNGNRIRFIPNLSASAAAILTVKRLPLVDLTGSSIPEVPADYYQAMKHYVAHLSYQKPDSQTSNPKASMDHLELFTMIVGPSLSIKEQYERKNRKKRSFNLRDTSWMD